MNKEKLEAMKAVLKIQGSHGNWNYDSYMMGMYNGMELMMAIVEDREPVFKDAPEEWLDEVPSPVFVESPPFKLKVIKGGLGEDRDGR